MDGKGTGGDSEWRDQCRRWKGNRNGMCGWQGVPLEGSRRPARDEGGKGRGGSQGQTERRGGPGGRSIATGLGRKPVGGCDSAEMRRPAIRSTAHVPILARHWLDRGHGIDSWECAKWQSTIWLLNLNDDTMCPHVWRWGKCAECVWLRGW